MPLFNKLRAPSIDTVVDTLPTLPFIQEEATIDTHTSMDDIADPLYIEAPWPCRVYLQVYLYPFFFETYPVWVQEKSLDRMYPSVDLYHHNPVVEKSCPAVAFVYQGEGDAFFENQSAPFFFKGTQVESYHFSVDAPLYVKPFSHQQRPDRGNILQQLILNSKNQWVPEIDKPPYRPLYPFGGTYITGLPLEQMSPLYFHISNYQEKTVFFTETDQSYRESILHPGKTVFKLMHPLTAEESCSVAEALRAGFAHLFLSDTQNNQQKYVSYGFESLVPSQNHYKIYYKMEK